jgi:hypothetical protein
MFNSITSGAAAYLTGGMTANKVAAKTSTATSSAPAKDPVSEFLAYQKLTPQQKIRDAYLKRRDLTEDSLAQLPLKERMKIEEEIRQEILKEMQGKLAEKGILLDMSA